MYFQSKQEFFILLTVIFILSTIVSTIEGAINESPPPPLIEEAGQLETELKAADMLREAFPARDGYTFGVQCYAPPRWCHAAVLHEGQSPIFLDVYCGGEMCKIEE